VSGDWPAADEEQFLVRSLADAAEEHAAGDLSDEDFDLLTRRDEARLAEVRRARAEAGPGQGGAPADEVPPGPDQPGETGPETGTGRAGGRRGGRAVLALVGVVLVTVATVLSVQRVLAPAAPGQPVTGSVRADTAQQVASLLNEADQVRAQGQTNAAIALYGQVLRLDPRQVQALTELGWLLFQEGRQGHEPGTEADGRAYVQRAVTVDPRFPSAHLDLGLITYLAGDDPAGAAAQFDRYLALGTVQADLDTAAPDMAGAYAAAGRPVPAPVRTALAADAAAEGVTTTTSTAP
jgi:tetratricopeptide (TPR) repeat protein